MTPLAALLPSRAEAGRPSPAALWLWLSAALVVLAIQIPGPGNVDTARRLHYTRSLWTTAPPVQPGDYPEFGTIGAQGIVQPTFGVGQSLIMLPADLVAGWIERWAPATVSRVQLQRGVVATLTFPALNATTLVLVWVWLGQLGFGATQRMAGTLSLLLATTFLRFAQVHMENSLQVALLFLDAVCLWRWLQTGSLRWLGAASATVAFALLVRLPALGEHLAVWTAGLGLALHRHRSGHAPGAGSVRARHLATVALPILLAGFALERIVHRTRFGVWTGTYASLREAEARAIDPHLPDQFPFHGDFWEGFLGPIFSGHRSLFLYDPLAALLLLVAVMRWRQLPGAIRWVLGGGTLGWLLLLAFYARYCWWAGGDSWGNRFTLPPIHLLLPLALPLCMQGGWVRATTGRMVVALTVVCAGVIQGLSLLLPSAVEHGQTNSQGLPVFLLGQRVHNVVALARGLPPPPGVDPPLWRLNLAPATLGAVAPRWQTTLWALWAIGVAGTAATLATTWCVARRSESANPNANTAAEPVPSPEPAPARSRSPNSLRT